MRWTLIPDAERYKQSRMVHWYNPPHSFIIGLEAFLGSLFGPFTDRREMQAALSPCKEIYNYDAKGEELWVDFIADTGDGWNSTYTMAWMVAQPSLTLRNHGEVLELPRGQILVMGGDEVYPIAKEEEYRYRTKGPFEAALPKIEEKQGPDLFAIPGNHDWYDGLLSWLRIFCQQRHIGAWQTRQHRSYFALRLPYNWWLWGIDTQLRADIDKPQRDYFNWVGEEMRKGDRVILVAPVPGWLHINRNEKERRKDAPERGPHRIMEFLEEDIIRKKGGDLCLTLAGDWHHYTRYEDVTATRHKISSGGGGAFLHGTHTLPRFLSLKEDERTVVYCQASSYPNAKRSRSLVWGNLAFPFKNLLFSWLILGTLYLLHAWILQRGSQGLLTNFSAQIKTISLSDWFVLDRLYLWFVPDGLYLPHAFIRILGVYLDVVKVTPEVLVFPFGLLVVATFFCTPREGSYAFLGLRKLIGGLLHSGCHWMLSLILFWGFVYLNHSKVMPWLEPFFKNDPQSQLATWFPLLLFSIEMIFIGGSVAGFLFGLYLLLANRLFHFHEEQAFSSLRIQDFKNFLRLRISPESLTVYPIGVDKVPRHWKMRPLKGQESRFEPRNGQIKYRLIEDPIVITGSDPGLKGEPREEALGFAFQETMAGWFFLGEDAPDQGAARGRQAKQRLTLHLMVKIKNLDRFICDESHRGILHGQIILPALSQSPIQARKGFVELFAPHGTTGSKRMNYELEFSIGERNYYLAGEKLVEDEPGIDAWSDTTTLLTRLYRGVGKQGEILGAGILRLSLRGLVMQVASMRALNAAGLIDRLQAFGVFLQFFGVQMWDSYFKRAKGFSFKALLFPWLGLGTFYLVHSWALGNKFFQEVHNIPGSGILPWKFPGAIHSLVLAYWESLTTSPWIVGIPLTLWLCLTLYSVSQDAYPQLDRSARLWRSVLSGLHTVLHVSLNLMLIWTFVHLNTGLLAKLVQVPATTLLNIEMLLIGGYAAGWLFRIVKQVKLRRPYVG